MFLPPFFFFCIPVRSKRDDGFCLASLPSTVRISAKKSGGGGNTFTNRNVSRPGKSILHGLSVYERGLATTPYGDFLHRSWIATTRSAICVVLYGLQLQLSLVNTTSFFTIFGLPTNGKHQVGFPDGGQQTKKWQRKLGDENFVMSRKDWRLFYGLFCDLASLYHQRDWKT